MSQFDDRKRGEELKFSVDQATQFKVDARRNKLVGLWAADLLGLTGDDAEAYAKTVVIADLEEPGDEDLIRKVLGDFDAKGVDKTREDILRQLQAMAPVALEQIKSEAG